MNQESNERERVKICLLRQFHIDCNHTENQAIAREGKPELVSLDMAGQKAQTCQTIQILHKNPNTGKLADCDQTTSR